jgi:hypothetical protein
MITLRSFTILITLALLSASGTQGQPARLPTDAEFAEQLKLLQPKHDKETRLRALGWIGVNSCDKHDALAIPALEKCIRDDPKWEVRQRAVSELSRIARRLDKPCPLVILEALHDKEDLVRYQAVECAGLFKTFAPGSAEVLLRGVKADNAELRSSSLYFLARVAGKDRKALEAMEKAKQDKVLDVRHSAHMALFIAKDKLEEHLPYLIRVREDPASVLSPVPEDSEQGKQERMYRNLVLLGMGIEMIGWSETRPDELAGVLMKLLKDDSAVMRRGAARLIGACVVKQELPIPRNTDPLTPPTWKRGWMESLLPYSESEVDGRLEKDSKSKETLQKSKAAQRLEKLAVESTLRRLQDDDPDRSVRDAARWALERLLAAAAADDKGPNGPAAPAQQYQALLKERQALPNALSKAKTEEERQQLLARLGKLPLKFLELAEQHPNDPVAVEALIQTVALANGSAFPADGKDRPGSRALAILERDHVKSDKLGPACQHVVFGFHKSHETFLRAVVEMNPHPQVQGLACLSLAQFLNDRLHRLAILKDQDGLELDERYRRVFGKDLVEELQRQDRARVAQEVEALFARAAERYPDVKIPVTYFGSGGTVGEKARAELFQIRHLAVGKVAPDIEGEDQDGKPFKLSDYRGKVLLLDFWYHL